MNYSSSDVTLEDILSNIFGSRISAALHHVMQHRTTRSLVCAALLASYSIASTGGDWATFSSDVITPKPVVWETEDWHDFAQSKDAPFLRYSFRYPTEWSFTGHSVFVDARKRKVAEIAPGVVALAKNQRCFDSSAQSAPRSKAFRLGSVKGRVIMEDVVFHDSPEKFRNYFYCIEQERYAFTVIFLERRSGQSMAGPFQEIIRSFRFE